MNHHMPISPSALTAAELGTTEQGKKPGAWIVLLTRPSYLPGIILLGHSLKKVQSKYPLVVAVTPSLPQYAVDALLATGLEVKYIQPIGPKTHVNVVAERFEDTWTKLSAFGFDEYQVAFSSPRERSTERFPS